MPALRAVLIDLYDTLVWSEWPALRAMIEQRTGLSTSALLGAFDRTRAARAVGRFGSMEGDLEVVLADAGIERDEALVRDLTGLITAFLADGVHLWDESLPVLRELRSRGHRTAIVSNCDHGTRPVVERLGLEHETDAVVLSFEVGVAKPEAGIYLRALEAVGAAPGEAVFVDDQPAYCDGASAVGIRPFLLVRDEREDAGAPGGHEVIRDLRALLDLI